MKLVSSLFVIFSLISALADPQKFCPMMIDTEIDPEEFVEYKGVKIELCCGSCVKQFKKNPDYYVKLTKGLLPQIPETLVSKEVKLMEQKFCLVYNKRVVTPKSYKYTHEGKDYYFWSNSAIRRFSKNPERYITRYENEKADAAKKLKLKLSKENKKASANSDG